MTPSTVIVKQDGQTGVVRPSTTGILAIIAGSASGTADTPSTHTKDTAVATEFGYGRLTSWAAYALSVTRKPVLLNKCVTSTAGAYGSVTLTGTGLSVPTGDGSVKPYDDFKVKILVVTGGTVGVSGITYKTSVDDGENYGAETALGTATSITIANTGVKINFTAATLVAGDVVSVTTTGPIPTTSDLTASLAALKNTSQPWDAVLIDGAATATIIAQVDTWLLTLEAMGRYKTAIVTLRRRAETGETEAQYATAMAAIVSASSSLGLVVCADVADSVDRFLGVKVVRPWGLFAAARGMAIDIAEDPAYVARGPIPNCFLKDSKQNYKYHDEFISPTLDTLRLCVARTFDDQAGVFINNAPILSPAGSDYVYWQHARVMNALCTVARQRLDAALSKGVAKSPKPGPNGERYILEDDAQTIEGDVNGALTNVANGRVSEAQFILRRDDNIAANSGATINAALEVVPKSYVKTWNVAAKFVKTLSGKLAA